MFVLTYHWSVTVYLLVLRAKVSLYLLSLMKSKPQSLGVFGVTLLGSVFCSDFGSVLIPGCFLVLDY